jgi:parallel beta-helix repeat protein
MRRTKPGITLLLIIVLYIMAVHISCSDEPEGPSDGGDEEDPTYCEMQPLPDPAGDMIVVGSVEELAAAVGTANATGNLTILLEDGTYQISAPLYIAADNVTLRSVSENRDNVTIRGGGIDGAPEFIFILNGDGLTIADMTIGWVVGNAIQVFNDTDDLLLHNLRIADSGQHLIKVLQSAMPGELTDRGEVRFCLLEYTAGQGMQEYMGGIMAAEASGWTIRHSTFRGIKAPGSGLSGPAIMFWDDSEDTVIEHNNIYNCDRGIFVGYGGSGLVSHYGGMVRNNMVHTNKDVGIALQSAQSASVYNNTVFTEVYSFSIEYRYGQTTNASIINNLTNLYITTRDGGTGVLETNFTGAQASWFVNATGGDLRLAGTRPDVIDQGTDLTAVPIDYECDGRPDGDSTDIGADEY